ncbi:prokaryotic E2 ligase family D protein [Lysinibacillus xylanilyticus]|uniref:hypothetical protein n=1 Tax=Lysinibacillus xylanilyticus TaxID=582475 RepID=UPI002B25620D|nr:hypothetical protein [Lysinibacillus xylanilyticus]MEB2301614.1 prokaryotic E2 ligase family D protein [Lysinibacillus xylanilyticus]
MEWHIKIPCEPNDLERFIEGTLVNSNGSVQGPFMLTTEEIIEAFQSLIKKDQTSSYVQLPLLPNNTLHFTHNRAVSKVKLLMLFEPEMTFIQHSHIKGDGFFIETPRTIFCVELAKMTSMEWQVKKVTACAVDTEEINEDSNLFQFPFPHVTKQSGNICWGTNSLPTFRSLKECVRLKDLFYRSPFSEDYGMALLSGFSTFKDYLQANEEKSFNHNDLIPMNKKLRDLM